jgi:PPOX class probable F420-dependent enzyme
MNGGPLHRRPADAEAASRSSVATTVAPDRGATAGTRHSRMSPAPTDLIPASFSDLVECPRVAALTTVMPDGYPQTSVVWCDFDGMYVRVNTMRGFQKERNMRRNPLVTLLCYDPRVPARYLEVRGTVIEMTEAGAAAHLDAIASSYLGRAVRYFGDVIDSGVAVSEVPVLCRILPTHCVARDWTGEDEPA